MQAEPAPLDTPVPGRQPAFFLFAFLIGLAFLFGTK